MTENYSKEFPDEFLELLKKIQKKRPKTVIDHIIKNGYITTEEIENQYGYKHAPRAARDVREEGIPLETFNVKDSTGRTIAAYRFGDTSKIRGDLLGGRKIFSKEFKTKLIERLGSKCLICQSLYEDRYLQVDHRIPYEVIGDQNTTERVFSEYMLLCGSCNRAKSWSCEHCNNWINDKATRICQACYWANPESYKHIALRLIRRLDIVWEGKEVEIYEKLKKAASHVELPDYVKKIIKDQLTTENK